MKNSLYVLLFINFWKNIIWFRMKRQKSLCIEFSYKSVIRIRKLIFYLKTYSKFKKFFSYKKIKIKNK